MNGKHSRQPPRPVSLIETLIVSGIALAAIILFAQVLVAWAL